MSQYKASCVVYFMALNNGIKCVTIGNINRIQGIHEDKKKKKRK